MLENFSLNQEIFLFFNSLTHKNIFLDYFFIFIGEHLIFFVFAIFFFLSFLYFWKEKKFYEIFIIFFSVFFVAFFVLFLKESIYAPRPFIFFEEIKTLKIHEEIFNSFPSNHTAITFALAFWMIFFTKKKWLKISFIFLAIFSGLGRILVGVHFPFDVFFGGFLAILICLFFYYFFLKKKCYNFFVMKNIKEIILGLVLVSLLGLGIYLFTTEKSLPEGITKTQVEEGAEIYRGKNTAVIVALTTCPHCQREVPIAEEKIWQKTNPEDLNLVVNVLDGADGKSFYTKIKQVKNEALDFQNLTGQECGVVPSWVVLDTELNLVDSDCGNVKGVDGLETTLRDLGVEFAE